MEIRKSGKHKDSKNNHSLVVSSNGESLTEREDISHQDIVEVKSKPRSFLQSLSDAVTSFGDWAATTNAGRGKVDPWAGASGRDTNYDDDIFGRRDEPRRSKPKSKKSKRRN